MKNLILTFFYLLICLASNANPYDLDQDEITREFAEVNAIEQLVETNQITDIESLKEVSPALYSSFTASNSLTFDNEDLPLGVPPFLWGCCFGLIGILLVVVITDNDKSATRKAAIGCLVSYGTIAVVYLILILAGVFTAGAFSTI